MLPSAILGIGLDLEKISRFEALLRLAPGVFCQRVFTPRELVWISGDPVRMALCFTAKEAVSKALGTGLRVEGGEAVGCREIETVPDPLTGDPCATLYGGSSRCAEANRMAAFRVAWRSSVTHAMAVAAALRSSLDGPSVQREMEAAADHLLGDLTARSLRAKALSSLQPFANAKPSALLQPHP